MGAYTNLTLALAWSGLSLVACNSGPSLTANQKRGKQIYEGLCDKCHKLIDPKKFEDQIWSAAAVKYGAKLKLTTEEIQTLTDYLTRANDENK